ALASGRPTRPPDATTGISPTSSSRTLNARPGRCSPSSATPADAPTHRVLLEPSKAPLLTSGLHRRAVPTERWLKMLHSMKRGLFVGSAVVVVAALCTASALAARGHNFGPRAVKAPNGNFSGFARFGGPGQGPFGGGGPGFPGPAFGAFFGGPGLGLGGPGMRIEVHGGPGGPGGAGGAALLAGNVLKTTAA